MWSRLVITSTLAAIIVGHEQILEGPGGIQRILSDNIRSVDYKLVYGDEEMTVINEVINDFEKNTLKKTINLNEAIAPLAPQDVKCMMSVDRYCSDEMITLKNIIVQAVKEDCAKCSNQEKEKAGKVIASLMAHDPVAWKMFLTRSALIVKKQEVKKEETKKVTDLKFKSVGEPEEVIRSPGNSFQLPGVNVRVKRFQAELVE